MDQHGWQRTSAGEGAFESAEAAVPSDYRRILGAIHADTHFNVIRGFLPQHSVDLVSEWLEELEEAGLIESAPNLPAESLDFTAYGLT